MAQLSRHVLPEDYWSLVKLVLPGLPHHVVQYGSDFEPCFFEAENYQYYLELWQTLSERYGLSVHAYCLMHDRIHFLLTPETITAIPSIMDVIGSQYAQYLRQNYQREIPWAESYRSTLVQSQTYLLRFMRYIELKPVRAKLVDAPEAYPWSSHGENTWQDIGWLKPHTEYHLLGNNEAVRREAYRKLFEQPLSEADLQLFRHTAQCGYPVGNDHFRQFISEKYGIKSA